MEIQYLVMFIELAFYFACIAAISFVELRWRQTPGGRGINEQSNSVITYYLGTFWYFCYRWLIFTSAFFIPVLAVSILPISASVVQGDSVREAIRQWAAFIVPLVLYFGVPMFLLVNLFGRKIGSLFFSYPEYALSSEKLYYRFFLNWHSVNWSDVTRVVPAKYIKRTFGFWIVTDKLPGLPRFYYFYRYSSAIRKPERYSIFLPCLLPGALELKAEIENRIATQRDVHR